MPRYTKAYRKTLDDLIQAKRETKGSIPQTTRTGQARCGLMAELVEGDVWSQAMNPLDMRELRNLHRAASRLAADKANLDALVREAYDKRLEETMDRKYSLRVIAEAAGISHEQVRRIING